MIARPDIKQERREQILAAFDRCAALHGFAGVTLEHVAQEAGLARALIRHNVGNREDLVAAAIERFFDRSASDWDQLVDGLPAGGRTRALCDRLLSDRASDGEMVLLTEGLIALAMEDRALAKRLEAWLDHALDRIAAVVRADHPSAEAELVAGIAGGILSVYFNLESFRMLGPMKGLEQGSLLAVQVLLDALEARAG